MKGPTILDASTAWETKWLDLAVTTLTAFHSEIIYSNLNEDVP